MAAAEDDVVQCVVHLVAMGYVLPTLHRLTADLKSGDLDQRVGRRIADRVAAIAAPPFSQGFEDAMAQLNTAAGLASVSSRRVPSRRVPSRRRRRRRRRRQQQQQCRWRPEKENFS